jgi:hypothetical protein
MCLKLLAERVRSLGGVFSVEASAAQFAVQANLPMDIPSASAKRRACYLWMITPLSAPAIGIFSSGMTALQ